MKLGVSDSFRGRADGAAYWEAWVAAVLSRAGLYTIHYPFEIDGREHGQSCDLTVSTDGRWSGVQVEVKSLNHTFCSSSDYRYDSVMVCSQNNFLRKWPGASKTGRDFLFVSRITGNIIWLPIDSPITVGHETFDSTRGESYKTVHAKKTDLRELCDFVEAVRGR